MSSTYFPVPRTFSSASTRLNLRVMPPSSSAPGTSRFSRKKSAAMRMASSIFLYPVQRQILPWMAFFTSCLEGFKFTSSRDLAEMIMPGIQKPHCTAPASAKQCTYTFISSSGIPSTVVTCLPSALESLTTQAFIFFPSTSTVQVPQAPSLHPSLTAVRPSSSLR